MKKLLVSLTLFCTVLTTVKAQNLLAKVPVTSSAVIKYAGENFTKNMPLQKLDTYGFIKDNFFKMLRIDTLTSIQNMGINFEQDTYQYVTMEDSAMSFVTLLHLKNAAQFLQLIKASYGTDSILKPIKKNGFEFLNISANTYIGWNATTAVIVNTSYQNKKSYYDYKYSTNTDSAVAVTTVTEAVAAPMADTAVSFTPPKIVKDKGVKKKSAVEYKGPVKKASAKTTTKGKAKSVVKKKLTEEQIAEKMAEENYRIQDSIENVKRELWDQQQDMIAKAKQLTAAEKIIANTFTGTVNSIENELSYKKIIDPAAHASVWLNYESLLKQYWGSMFGGAYYLFGAGRSYNLPVKDTTDGFKSAANMYFDKDKMRIEQKMFSADAKMAAMGRDIMNSKQNAALANYVNPDNIGYFSASINTEAMANYYYSLMKKYISSTPYMSEYSDMVNVYIDLLEIIIDEKGIADLLPGNYMFVMHDMKNKLVTYTDYDYDKDYNKTEVKKTKNELSPNFSFIMETRKEGFMQKLANLPLKYAEKGKYNYKDRGGYYELVFDSGAYPISSLYFMIKNGRGIITTSKEVIDMTVNNTGFATDAATKNSILNNNYSLNLNTKRLLQKIAPEFSTNLNKKISDYLLENMGDVKMESSIKDGMIQATTTMGIKGSHANSFEFFFNMIDAINNIIEKDKEEKEKSIN
jgi:Domain of unknown function (DUF4836)